MNLLHRKIDEQVSDAIANLADLKTSNTTVTVTDDKVIVKLHGQTLATIRIGDVWTGEGNNTVKDITGVNFNHCDWHTQTTRNRLNAVVHALHRRDYAHKIGGFKIQNGIIHIQHYGEWISFANAGFDYDQ